MWLVSFVVVKNKMLIFTKKLKRQQGFTLIEMMVAVSIFVIVAFIVVSTLLTLSYAYKKAQKMRLLMDNFNFALQSMSINIREGVSYQGGGGEISFTPIDSWVEGSNKRICYKLEGDRIKKCDNDCATCSGGSYITSSDIKVTDLQFTIGIGDKKLVKIFVKGTAGNNRDKTEFAIQNSVSQRNMDI